MKSPFSQLKEGSPAQQQPLVVAALRPSQRKKKRQRRMVFVNGKKQLRPGAVPPP
jgi:hypothetical protein